MLPDYSQLLATFASQPNDALSAYFSVNAEQIDTLIQLYNEYNRHILQLQEIRIQELNTAIAGMTNDQQWKDNEGLELEYHYPNPAISIIAGFESDNGDPFAKFNIYITTPNIQSWNHYEDKLLTVCPEKDPQIAGNKTILLINSLSGHDNDQLLEALRATYALLSSLTFARISYSLTSY